MASKILFASTDAVWLISPKIHPKRVGKPSWLASHPPEADGYTVK